jgi:hypothetical protein
VEIKVYSVLGKLVAMLVNEELNAGLHSVEMDTDELPAGLYLYSMQAGDFHQIRKMQVLD